MRRRVAAWNLEVGRREMARVDLLRATEELEERCLFLRFHETGMSCS